MPSVPRVCGDDPVTSSASVSTEIVFPAYAGMIPEVNMAIELITGCSPRMRG